MNDAMRKRLLVIHPTLAPYRVDYFNALDKAYDAKICFCYRNLLEQKFERYDDLLAQCNFKPDYLPRLFRIGARVFNRGIISRIREFHPDIVMTMEFRFATMMALCYRFVSRRKFKLVIMCDDSYNMAAENNDFTRLHKVLRKLITPLIDDLVIVDSRATEWYKANYGKGIWMPIISREERSRQIYERVLPVSNGYIERHSLAGKSVFLFVGRLVGLKNVGTLISAFEGIKDSVLVIVGSGEEEPHLRTLAETDRNVIFTGRLEGDELYAWYNVATAMVLPSLREAFGAVTYEALSAGCDALVSARAGSACIIKPGENGDVFDPLDINGLHCLMARYTDRRCSLLSEMRPSKMVYDFDAQIAKLVDSL